MEGLKGAGNDSLEVALIVVDAALDKYAAIEIFLSIHEPKHRAMKPKNFI